MILLKSMILAALVMVLLKPFCYLLCFITLEIDKMITKISNSKLFLLFKIPLFIILYPPFYMLGITMIVISYILGYDLLDESIDSL